jgi:hypothetical protein
MKIDTRRPMKLVSMLLGLVSLVSSLAAQEPPPDEAKRAGKRAEDFPAATKDFLHDMDMVGKPDEDQPAKPTYLELNDPDQIRGRNTWVMWCGGNEWFWDWLAQHSFGFLDFLKIVGSPTLEEATEKRSKLFRETGLMNEPGCQFSQQPDSYSGLFLAQPDPRSDQPREDIYGRSSGVVGLRLFKNPEFNEEARKNWDVKRYFEDKNYYTNPKLVRPYRVGMSCGFCHVAPHPLNPPANPEEPKWENLSSIIGNQYWRTRAIVGSLLTSDNFVYHVLDSQPPGTIDTSLVASDNINNANTINTIFELPERLRRAGAFLGNTPENTRAAYENLLGTNGIKLGTNRPEQQSSVAIQLPSVLKDVPDPKENPRFVPRVLLDGADSIGAWGALARVYLNIGTYGEQWIQLHNPLIGFVKQKPFKIKDCEENSVYWQVNTIRTVYLAKFFLASTPAMRLKDAPGGPDYLKKDADGKPAGVPWSPALKEGRRVFAQNCIACHSSRQPDFFEQIDANELLDLLHKPAHPFYTRYREWALAAVENPVFWKGNFLSTDRRVPVSLIGTNAGRALASNAIAGHMWEDFSSDTYKHLPEVGKIQIYNPYIPLKGDETFNDSFPAPGGGRGYYRPATLVSIWATAPYLHNNSVGIFNNDPSVKGRMEAFEDGIRKLLVQARKDENDTRSWDELVAEAAKKRYLGYKDERLGWKAPDLDHADPAQLEKDHGLIWRTTEETTIQIPGSQLGDLAHRLTGLPLPVLDQIPWVIPAAITLIGVILLGFWPSHRLVRILSYFLIFAGVVIAGWFSVILKSDLRIGPIPAGTPVDLITNLDPEKMDKTVAALKLAIWTTKELKKLDPNNNEDQKKAEVLRNKLGEAMLEASKCPDLVMDRGHYTAAALTPKEQQDLIDLIKSF